METSICRLHGGLWDARFTLKGTGPAYAPDRTFDTEHIRLTLSVDLTRETLTGRCTTFLRAIADGAKEMTFDAVHLDVRGVLWDGKKVGYAVRNEKIVVHSRQAFKAGDKTQIEISYRVRKPKMGLYFIKPDRHYPKRPLQVWTQGEDEYARYWFPCHDAPHERTTTEVIVTVPAGFTAVSNGKLLGRSVDKRTKAATFHWRQDIPHATYLVTLTVGRFSHLKNTWRGKPVDYYCEKGREDDTRRAFGKTPKMLEFFSDFIGVKYPFAKYAQIAAADFIYGGMENTSATTQTDTALLDQRSALDYTSDELVAHELAHQWFGDYLTCKDWSHAWLNESFATYFDPLFKRHDKGEDEFLYAIHTNAEIYMQEDKEHYRRSIVTKAYRRPSDLFDRHLYEKGSVVLFMLHRLLGEELFRKSIQTYVRKNAGRVVETVDLINAIEETTGRNLRRFFDQWVFGAGHPEFKIRAWWEPARKELKMRITQTHAQGAETGLFSIKTDVVFLLPKGQKRESISIEKKSHLLTFKLEAEPSLVLFDPDHAILKRVDFPKSERQWILQLNADPNVLGRIDAALTLGRIGSTAAVEALRHALISDRFWGVQAEAARALSQTGREDAQRVLLHALDEVQNPKVRRAVYAALRTSASSQAAFAIEKRFRKEKSYFANAEALRTLGALHHPNLDTILKEALALNSWNDVTRIAALESLAGTRSRDAVATLLTYTKRGHHQRLRMTAVRLLAQFDAASPDIQKRLLELINDDFLLVRIAAVRSLTLIGDERAIPALKKLTTGDLDGRLKRLAEEAVDRITKGFE